MLSQICKWNITTHSDHDHLCWASRKMSFQCSHVLWSIYLQGSFSGAISRYSRIFLQEIASKFQEWEKKSHAEFFSFRAVKFLFSHAVHFETIGLFCLTGFWIIVAPKFITHMNAGNHSLICIIEKLYRKNSLSVSGLSKRLFDRYLESAKTCPPTRKKNKKKENYPTRSRPVGMATC